MIDDIMNPRKPSRVRAFPRPGTGDGGMLLRDYFAAKAPQPPFGHERRSTTEQQVVAIGGGRKHLETVTVHEPAATWLARWAYEYADAMLAEREKP